MLRRFSRTSINFLLDVLLLVLFVALCTTAVIVEFVFPAGPQAQGWTLWGRSQAEWSRIEFLLLATMAAAVLLHVMLHWSWVCGVVSSKLGRKTGAAHDDPTRTLWGVGLLILIINVIGVVVAVASLTIQSPGTGP